MRSDSGRYLKNYTKSIKHLEEEKNTNYTKIYFDLNVIIDYMSYYKNNNVNYEAIVQKINSIIGDQSYRIYYSPAHIEEIAIIGRSIKEANKYIFQHFRAISKISKNNEILPGRYSVEYPKRCYERVKEYYYLTYYAECNEECKRKMNCNNQKIQELFVDSKLKENFLSYILSKKREQASELLNKTAVEDYHSFLEAGFEFCFDFLEYELGYKKEKRNKTRSRMHDITHSIYASYTDIFVTNDQKLSEKAKIVYAIFDIKTKILVCNEFLKTI